MDIPEFNITNAKDKNQSTIKVIIKTNRKTESGITSASDTDIASLIPYIIISHYCKQIMPLLTKIKNALVEINQAHNELYH